MLSKRNTGATYRFATVKFRFSKRHKGSGTLERMSPMTDGGFFSPEDASKEVERLVRPSRPVLWNPSNEYKFELTIPPTVYPPREDTDLMATRLISFGPGRGRKLLEIGCGSGALCLLAASLGWNVSACDINPFSVAATKGNLELYNLQGKIKEGGVSPEKFPFEGNFDLIIWNLPYIPVSEIKDVLGPMEEAALIDTDEEGLGNRLISCIVSNQLLAPNGRILILSRENVTFNNKIFAIRKWDKFDFEDGEKIAIFCLWRPFENAISEYVKSTGSTNDDLMKYSGIGSHISTSRQHSGRGRRNREWFSIESSYAGSWIVSEGEVFNPGMLQLSGGLAVLNSINDQRLKLKWPNDIILDGKKLCGILVEGKTLNNETKVIIGIGINLKNGENFDKFKIASLDELTEITHEELDVRLNRELSSLLEEKQDLPPINLEIIREHVMSFMSNSGKPKYDGVIYKKFGLNERGELLLGDKIIDDGEDVEWI